MRLLHACWNERVSYNLNGYSKCVEKPCLTRSDRTTPAPTLRTRRRFIYFHPAPLVPPPGCNRRGESADFGRDTYHTNATRRQRRRSTRDYNRNYRSFTGWKGGGGSRGIGLRAGILCVHIVRVRVLVVIFVTGDEATWNFVGFPLTGPCSCHTGLYPGLIVAPFRRDLVPPKPPQHNDSYRVESIDTRFRWN